MPDSVSSFRSLPAALLGALSASVINAAATGTPVLDGEGSRMLPARQGKCLLQESFKRSWAPEAFNSLFRRPWQHDLPLRPDRSQIEMTFVDMGPGVCQTLQGNTPNFQERPAHLQDCQVQCGGEPGCAGFTIRGISCMLYFEGPLRASGAAGRGEEHCLSRVFPNQQEGPLPAETNEVRPEVIRPQSETSMLAGRLSEAEAEANEFRLAANQSESEVVDMRRQLQEAREERETGTRVQLTSLEDKLRAAEAAMTATSNNALTLKADLLTTQRELEKAKAYAEKAKHEAEGYRAQLARVSAEMEQYKNRTNMTKEEEYTLRHRLVEVTGVAKKWHHRAKKLERKLRQALDG